MIVRMSIAYLNSIIPLKRMLILCAAFVLIIETIVIAYIGFTGYVEINSFGAFWARLSYSFTFSYLSSVVVAYMDLYVIAFLNQRYTWSHSPFFRTLLEALLIVVIAVIMAILLTLLSEFINSYKEPLVEVIINNILIISVANVLITAVLELWIALFEKNKEKDDKEKLALEVNDLKMLVLKNQSDPHFLFNSLNILISLIDIDTQKAKRFTEDLAYVYRYVVETMDYELIDIEEEIDFVKAYISLLKIRYGDVLKIEIDLNNCISKLPPLTLQSAVENAIKHNAASAEKPLQIYIYKDNQYIVVANNLQDRAGGNNSTGKGQENISHRYKILGSQMPLYYNEDNFYYCKFPIIVADDNEDNNY